MGRFFKEHCRSLGEKSGALALFGGGGLSSRSGSSMFLPKEGTGK